ncbi:MAG TPA: hypothetical protein VLA05_04395 [Coriobacteriia bacterium]|nr:hypothetical protein [Coriobacteriia bacterium]
MCCWIALAFAFAPRFVLVLMWLFNDWITEAFGNIWLPLIGFFILPWTTLAYTLVAPGGLTVLDIAILVIAVVADLGAYGGGARSRNS